MSIDSEKVIERSVDSIQKIYAVVIALAISQAIQSLLKVPGEIGDFSLGRLSSGAPGFVAFLVTLVPFWHGIIGTSIAAISKRTPGLYRVPFYLTLPSSS